MAADQLHIEAASLAASFVSDVSGSLWCDSCVAHCAADSFASASDLMSWFRSTSDVPWPGLGLVADPSKDYLEEASISYMLLFFGAS